MAAACSFGSRSQTTRSSVSSARTRREARPPPRREAAEPVERGGHLEPVRRDRVGGRDEAPEPRHGAHLRVAAPTGGGGQRRPGQLLVEHAGVPLHGRQGRGSARARARGARRRGGPPASTDRARDRPSCPAPNPVRRRPRPSPPTAAAGSPVGGSARGLPTMTTMARFTTPETLPEGDEKVEAVRTMFDAIAPRYDLVNRIMTFRMDVRWRRRTVESLDLASRRDRARPGLRHRRPLPRAQRRRPAADRRRPVLRDARRGPHRCPARARRRLGPPPARRRRRRGHLRVRAAQLRQPPSLLRRARADRAARGPHRPPRGGRATEPVPSLGPRRLLREGGAPGRRAPVRPGRLPLPAPIGRLPPRARCDAGRSSAPPASRTSSAACCRSASPSSSPRDARQPDA